jgi:hypothetical protein
LRDVSYLVRDWLWSVQLVGSRARGLGVSLGCLIVG